MLYIYIFIYLYLYLYFLYSIHPTKLCINLNLSKNIVYENIILL